MFQRQWHSDNSITKLINSSLENTAHVRKFLQETELSTSELAGGVYIAVQKKSVQHLKILLELDQENKAFNW